MAEKWRVNIIWEDSCKQTCTNSFECDEGNDPDIAAVAFASALALFNNAGVKAITKSINVDISALDQTLLKPRAGEMSTVDQKAVCSFVDKTTGESRTWQIPAPKLTIFENVPKAGKRVTETDGQNLAKELNAGVTGWNLYFLEGWLGSDK